MCLRAGASLSSAPYPWETAFPAAILPIGCGVTHAADFLSRPLAPTGLSHLLPPFLGREGCEMHKLLQPHSPEIAVLSCAGTSQSGVVGLRILMGGITECSGAPAWLQPSCCPRCSPWAWLPEDGCWKVLQSGASHVLGHLLKSPPI